MAHAVNALTMLDALINVILTKEHHAVDIKVHRKYCKIDYNYNTINFGHFSKIIVNSLASYCELFSNDVSTIT